jgi:hypothetical protein
LNIVEFNAEVAFELSDGVFGSVELIPRSGDAPVRVDDLESNPTRLRRPQREPNLLRISTTLAASWLGSVKDGPDPPEQLYEVGGELWLRSQAEDGREIIYHVDLASFGPVQDADQLIYQGSLFGQALVPVLDERVLGRFTQRRVRDTTDCLSDG